jgi:antitoxin MazE
MKARIVTIGKARGVRRPERLLRLAGISDEVTLAVVDGAVVVRPVREVRKGWAQSCREMAASGDDRLLDAPVSNAFDADEWQWE